MPFCSNCGSKSSQEDNFCTKCGQALDKTPRKSPQKNGKRANFLLIAIIVVLSVVIVIAVLLVLYKNNQESRIRADLEKSLAHQLSFGSSEKDELTKLQKELVKRT